MGSKKPSYVIFGLGGAIGASLLRTVSNKIDEYRIFAFDHARADITNAEHVNHLIEYVKPTVVFNCAGISDPEICEEAKAGAFRINGIGPSLIAKACMRNGCRLVHFSSWSVLEGNKVHSHSEKSNTNPSSAYGQSKLHGEQSCLISCPSSLVIRSGCIFGEDQAGLIQNWLSNADRRLYVRVPKDVKISPTYVEDLTEAAFNLANTEVKGIVNVSNSGTVSWEDFAKEALTLCKLPDNLVIGSNSAFKAKLPNNCSLSCTKYKALTGKTLRPWKDALKECLFHMNRYAP